jgi:hypothetical protein
MLSWYTSSHILQLAELIASLSTDQVYSKANEYIEQESWVELTELLCSHCSVLLSDSIRA